MMELDQLGNALAQNFYAEESKHQKAYHETTQKLQTAQKSDDTYEIGELSKEQSKHQQAYWQARNKRESVQKGLEQQQLKMREERFREEVKVFNEEIVKLVPDWNEKIAKEVRDFALEEGLPESLLNVITEPTIVKFVYDYKNLKKGVTKGTAKRKVAKTLKTPVKKSRPVEKKRLDQEAMIKARAFKEDASKEDHDAFLKQYATQSLNST